LSRERGARSRERQKTRNDGMMGETQETHAGRSKLLLAMIGTKRSLLQRDGAVRKNESSILFRDG